MTATKEENETILKKEETWVTLFVLCIIVQLFFVRKLTKIEEMI